MISGNVTRRNTVHATGAERRGRVLVAPVHRPQRGLDRDDEERHGDERLGHDRTGRRERELDPEPVVEVLPDEPVAPERVEEPDAADDGWQHHRQQHERAHQRAARELDAREHPGQRHAEHHRERGRPQRAHDREPQRGRGRGLPEVGPEVAPRDLSEQTDQREHEEREPDERDEDREPRNPCAPLPHGAGRNPYELSVAWPADDVT